MKEKYSPELSLYVERIELCASKAQDSFEKYMVFHDAINSLSNERLSEEDSKLAKQFLWTELDKAKPKN